MLRAKAGYALLWKENKTQGVHLLLAVLETLPHE